MATTNQFGDVALGLFKSWGDTKIANVVKPGPPISPPMPRPVPAPARDLPQGAAAASMADINRQLSEIAASPKTWIVLAAIVGGILYLVMRRR